MGLDDRAPALHAFVSKWREALPGEAQGWATAKRRELLHDAGTLTNSPDRHRKPGVHHVLNLAQAGSNHSAVAVRPWRDKGNVPLAQEPTEAGTHGNHGRPRATNLQDAAVC